MRRLAKAVVVLSLAVSLTTATAYAVPRRDDGDINRSPLQKIVQIIKRIVKGLDGGDITWPKP